MIHSKKIQFDCFKAYEESTIYRNGADTIIIRSVYHYATLIYSSDSNELPEQSVDGNYYHIPDPDSAEIGDVYFERTEINMADKSREKLYETASAKMSVTEFEQMLMRDQFKASVYQVMYGKGTLKTEL